MIRWFTKNGVAANLLAGIIIIAGFFYRFNNEARAVP